MTKNLRIDAVVLNIQIVIAMKRMCCYKKYVIIRKNK